MKKHLNIWLAAGWLAVSSQAQDTAPVPGGPAPEAAAPRLPAASADDEAYAALLKSELDLSTQFRLLSNLAQEHRKRAEAAAATNQAQRALWENELAQELSETNQALVKQLAEASRQRLAFEQAHKGSALSVGSLGAATGAARVTPQEVEFIRRLDERWDRISQDLATARQYSYDYAERVRTNTGSYDFHQATAALDQNARKIRQLEQEQADVELRKLEFQALRRP